MGRKLTDRQIERLREIASYIPSERWPNAGFWNDSRTDRSLIARGLIERADMENEFGYGLKATWHGCKLTHAGRLVLAAREKGGTP